MSDSWENEGEPRHLTREEERILDRALHAGATNARPIESAPSPAPEQRAETRRRHFQACADRWREYLKVPEWEPDRTHIEMIIGTLQRAADEFSVLPHPAPAADTIAVPRETLKQIIEGAILQYVEIAPAEYVRIPKNNNMTLNLNSVETAADAAAAEITRLLGETP